MRFTKPVLMALLLLVAAQAQAQIATFDLSYSGSPYGNAATATGVITLDLSLVQNPGITSTNGSQASPAIPFVKALSLTVVGAKSGNGTFTSSDFRDIALFNSFVTLDFSKELVGQRNGNHVFGGMNDGTTGDFELLNIYAPLMSPYRSFTIYTGSPPAGDMIFLTSFRPAAVPEPSPCTIFTVFTLTGAGFLARCRKQARKAF